MTLNDDRDGYSRHKLTLDLAIRAAAQRHGGVIDRAELRAIGLTGHAIAHRIRIGFLIRVHRGVYAVGHVPTEPTARAHAALLAVGPRSALSHASAATFWGVYRDWREPFHLSTPLRRAPAGLVVHRTKTLRNKDIHTDPNTGLLENTFLRIVERYALPTPTVNEHIEGERVDFFFADPGPGVIVEVDGYTAHSDPVQFAADRRRDRRIWNARRIPTLRFTFDDCVDSPDSVHTDVRRAIEPTP